MRFITLIFVIVVMLTIPLFAFEFDPDNTGDLVETLSKLKVDGKGYFYYNYDVSVDDSESNEFDFSRIYLGAKYHISEDFTIRYLNETNNLRSVTKLTYVHWSIHPKVDIVIGLLGMNNWKESEKAWGYRSIHFAPMEAFGEFWGSALASYRFNIRERAFDSEISENEERYLHAQNGNFYKLRNKKMGYSADLGVKLDYRPDVDTYLSFITFNGSGYLKKEDDRYKSIQLRAGQYLIDRRLHLSGFIEVEPWEGTNRKKDTDLVSYDYPYFNIQWDLMASFKRNGMFSVGLDLNGKRFDGIETINAMSYSVFGNFHVLQNKLKALARYDYYITGFNEGEVAIPGDRWETNGSLIVLGLDYMAHKNVHIIPNFQMLSFEDSDKDSQNTIYVHVSFKF